VSARATEQPHYASNLGTAQSSLAEILIRGDKRDEGAKLAREAVASLEQVEDALATFPSHRLRLAIPNSVLASAVTDLGERERHQCKTVAITSELARTYPHHDFLHGRCLGHLADTLRQKPDGPGALDTIDQAIVHVRRANDASPGNASSRQFWPLLLLQASGIQATFRDREVAIATLEQAVTAGPLTRQRVLQTPGIDNLRDDPEFRAVVGKLRAR